jgi:hypothetical protein
MRLAVQYILGLISIISSQFAVAQNCTLALSAQPTGTSCSNQCDGYVTLTPTGGTAPYTFNAFDHSFPGTSVDGSVFTVTNGNYSVSNNVLTAQNNASINNAYNNFISTNQAFNASSKLVAEASFYVDNNTFGYWGLAQSSTTLTTPTQIPISFNFNNGSLYTYNNGTTTLVGGYSSGTWYDLKIEKLGATVNYYIKQTGLSNYTLVTSQTTNSLAATYKLAATYRNVYDLYGGFKSMNWKIGGNPAQINLCTGTYTYTVYDAAGCYVSATVTVAAGTGPSSMKLNGSVTPASCAVSADGAIDLNPAGGTGPYSYGLSQNFGGSGINNNVFQIRNGNFSQNNELREGITTVGSTGWDNSIATRQTFSDGGYLKFEGSFKFDDNVDVAFGFADTSAVNNISSILFGFRIASGGNLYTLGGASGSQLISQLTSGSYYDFKIEKSASTINYYTRLTGTTTWSLAFTTYLSTSRIEYKFGVVNFSNASASLGGYTTKNWSLLVTPKVTKLNPGMYTYTITDAAGCSATSVFSVGQAGAPVTLAATLVKPSVVNGATGEVSITPGAGIAPYKYQLEENFNDSTVDQGLFTLRNGAFIELSDLRSNTVTGNPSWDNSIYTNLSFTDGGFISFAGSFKFDAGANSYFGFSTNSFVVNDPSQMVLGFSINGTQLSGLAGRNNLQSLQTISSNTWYDLMVAKTNGIVRFYMRATGATSYNLIYTLPYTDSLNVFRAGLVVFGTNGGMNTKNWVINSNPPLTGLAAGTYSYTVYDSKRCYATTSINVPAVSRNTISAQSTNSAAWNVCDGTVSFTNVPVGSTIYNIAYQQSFSGTQLPTSELTTRNGSYSVNGNLVSSKVSTVSNWDNSVVTTAGFNDNGYISAEMDMQFTAGSNVYFGLVNGNGALNNLTGMAYSFYYASGRLYSYTAEAGQTQIGGASGNTLYNFKIEKTGSLVNFYVRTPLDNDYQLIYTTTSNASGSNYRIGILNNASSETFSSKNWVVLNSGPTTGLCLGTYTYRIVSTGVSPVSVPFTVKTNVSIVTTMVAPADVTVGTNASQSYATNVSIGNPTFGGSASAVTVTNNAPSRFPVGVTIVTWTAIDEWGNVATGTQKVTVADREAPSIIAPADITITAPAGQTSVAGISLGSAVTSDNVAVTTVTNNAPASYPVGTTSITWTAKDAAGNTSTATQKVTIIASLIPTVSAPADVTTSTDATKSFATNVSLGYPSFSGSTVGLTITNNAPAQYPLGNTIVTWTIKDALGNTVTAAQNVTVADREAPSVIASSNIIVPTNSGVSYATAVNLGTPTTSDNVAVTSITNDAPSQFPVGVTTITWTAKDAAGNTKTATQTVTVVGPPSITAPGTLVVPSDDDQSYATVTDLGKLVFTGYNCTVGNNASSQFNIGTSTVTWTVTDQWGRTATATQTVTVAGPPTIVSPNDTTIAVASAGAIVTNLNLGTASYYVYNNTATPINNAPSGFVVGSTDVIWSIKDQFGRVASDVQTVNVIVPAMPTISAPPSITIQNDPNQTYATISSLGTPTYYAFGSTGPTNNGYTTGRYPVGTTYVLWTVKDQLGRTATAYQTIIVNSTCSPYAVTITSVQNSSILTGSGPNVIYIGYGAQSTTLQAAVPSINGPYTFSWSGSAGLSSTTSAAPVFAPTKAGTYTFNVTAKNAKNCTSTSSITICVRDVRVLDINGKWDGKKVYVCHLPPGNINNPQILSVSLNAVPAHVPLHGGDGLGKSCSQPCAANSAARGTLDMATPAVNPFVIKAYPNPSADYFTLLVNTTDKFTGITVRIMDAFGRTIQVFNNVAADKTVMFGDKYASGAYYAEVSQGQDRKVIPLMKAK